MSTNPNSAHPDGEPIAKVSAWKKIVARYQQPSAVRGLWQVANTLLPYAGLWMLMYVSLNISYWLIPPLAILAGGFLVRVFIIFHDCGHGSFFKSQRANDLLGFFTGVLTFTPYTYWRWEHARHHAAAGDLDRRGSGDVWTMTVEEYLKASGWKRLAYRLARNPAVLFILAPLFVFLIKYRFPHAKPAKGAYWSVHGTNLSIAAVAAGLSLVFGWKAYLLIQLLVVSVAGSAGIWLFYVQHQFEGVYWERSGNWDYTLAALRGSSFYKLPKVLQWFSGNIGFHHVHHLSPRIPNYHLEKCHKSEPLFQEIKPVTLFSSFKAFTFRLWDEQRGKLVSFGHLRTLREAGSARDRDAVMDKAVQ